MNIIGERMYIKFPGRITSIHEINLSSRLVTLIDTKAASIEIDVYVKEWPDITCKLPDVGLDSGGIVAKIVETWPPERLREHIVQLAQDIEPGFDGYLTVINKHFAVTRGVSKYVALTANPTAPKPIRVGSRTIIPNKVRASWFYGPKQDRPAVDMPTMPPPYQQDLCWIGNEGQCLTDFRWLADFINRHADQIADPFQWQDSNPQAGEALQYVSWITLKEE